MMLTNLAAVARSAGLRVVEQPGWRTRGHGQMAGVRAIVCHHTAGARTGNTPSLGVVQNGRPDLSGPLAHYLLARDGTVHVVAAGLCWHAGAVRNPSWGNAYSVGIEAEATGTDAWPEAQLNAYERLCKALCAAFGLPVSAVLGHKEVCAPHGRKTDPNFDMGAFRARVAATPATEEDDLTPHQAAQLDLLVAVVGKRYDDASTGGGKTDNGKWGYDAGENTRRLIGHVSTLGAAVDRLNAAVTALAAKLEAK
ncbi:N-acetylmuramoyl-L-alanine amidase [Amycolatopsis echigonensis]|uniref:N-acetylmuramoyl-L-alanine amidase n=1 Tax=Amycolatopsis echigonensis TaxID=2576905 RepID=A0A8E2B5K1_9PSEU|nr:peptidoglycan recognition family protein [Amycolatopsis echigonensis]MBB2500253.1 N-acetylmuramoyl-L-alanine amidase [Amycolatopsis echigonensis]